MPDTMGGGTIYEGSGSGAWGGLGTGFIGGLVGGALFGGGLGFGGRRGEGDVDSRVDTLALLQQGHANALQTANQTNDLTNRTFEQTITLKDGENRTQREVLENRFNSALEFGKTNANIDNKHWENRLAIADTNCHIGKVGAEVTAKILEFENRQILREKDNRISALENALGDIKLANLVRAETARLGGFISANFANTNTGLVTALPAAAPVMSLPVAPLGFPFGF